MDPYNDKRNYSAVGDQQSDLLRREQAYHNSQKEFVLYNNLPFTVEIVHEIPYPRKLSVIDKINPDSFLKIKPEQIKDGDIFHFMYKSTDGMSRFACPSTRVKLHLGGIIIGSIVSAQGGYNRDVHPNGDISSIRIHNMLAWSVFIYLNGKKVAFIDKNTELGTFNHGDLASSPHIYFDNSNKGLKINDQIEVQVITPEGGLLKWKKFIISDRYISEIFIGQNGTQVGAHNPPEVYFYRLNENSKINSKNNSVVSSIWPTTPKIPIKRYGVVNK